MRNMALEYALSVRLKSTFDKENSKGKISHNYRAEKIKYTRLVNSLITC